MEQIRLRAGELRHNLIIERRTDSKNEYKETLTTWTEIARVWGSLDPLSNRNFELARGVAANVAFEARMRYLPSVTNDCRCLLEGRTYYVAGVIHDPLRVWTQVFLTEQQA